MAYEAFLVFAVAFFAAWLFFFACGGRDATHGILRYELQLFVVFVLGAYFILLPNAKVLSALDSLVPVTNAERRMRPEHAWDGRRMLAFALGRVAHHTGAVGGPRAANRMGKAVAPGAVVQQTCQTMAAIS